MLTIDVHHHMRPDFFWRESTPTAASASPRSETPWLAFALRLPIRTRGRT
jgi:hypothetical protein